MVDKSLLRKTIEDILEERDINDGTLTDEIIDRLDTEGEVFDDEDEDEEEGDDKEATGF